MSRRGTGPKIKCDRCEQILRKSNFLKHETTHCYKRLVACTHCGLQTEIADNLLNHGNNCHSSLKQCQYCYQNVLFKLLTDHTANCPIIHKLIEKYKKFDQDCIINLMHLIANIYIRKPIQKKWALYKNEIHNLVRTKEVGLEAFICAKQFRYTDLQLICLEPLRWYEQPKQCVIEDLELILGKDINMYNARSLLTCSGMKTTIEINIECCNVISQHPFCYRFNRLYCEHEQFNSFDFVKHYYYENLMHLKTAIKSELIERVHADVSGLIMKYLFSGKLYVSQTQ